MLTSPQQGGPWIARPELAPLLVNGGLCSRRGFTLRLAHGPRDSRKVGDRVEARRNTPAATQTRRSHQSSGRRGVSQQIPEPESKRFNSTREPGNVPGGRPIILNKVLRRVGVHDRATRGAPRSTPYGVPVVIVQVSPERRQGPRIDRKARACHRMLGCVGAAAARRRAPPSHRGAAGARPADRANERDL